ncbi:MAG: hypothetical protein PHU12_02820 [Candidatus Aenigmarchaeota archaeon]|nr:hypothetical protein [Candidatus Aenigmarchaeota archaeon]
MGAYILRKLKTINFTGKEHHITIPKEIVESLELDKILDLKFFVMVQPNIFGIDRNGLIFITNKKGRIIDDGNFETRYNALLHPRDIEKWSPKLVNDSGPLDFVTIRTIQNQHILNRLRNPKCYVNTKELEYFNMESHGKGGLITKNREGRKTLKISNKLDIVEIENEINNLQIAQRNIKNTSAEDCKNTIIKDIDNSIAKLKENIKNLKEQNKSLRVTKEKTNESSKLPISSESAKMIGLYIGRYEEELRELAENRTKIKERPAEEYKKEAILIAMPPINKKIRRFRTAKRRLEQKLETANKEKNV